MSISVPSPSFARTDEEGNESGALPADLLLKVIVTIFPNDPKKPGLGTTPSNDTVPAELEKNGSCTQSVKIEPVLATDTTSSLSAGNDTAPETAFIAWSVLDTITLTEMVSPTPIELESGVMDSAAPNAQTGKIKKEATATAKIPFLKFTLKVLISYALQNTRNPQ